MIKFDCWLIIIFLIRSIFLKQDFTLLYMYFQLTSGVKQTSERWTVGRVLTIKTFISLPALFLQFPVKPKRHIIEFKRCLYLPYIWRLFHNPESWLTKRKVCNCFVCHKPKRMKICQRLLIKAGYFTSITAGGLFFYSSTF